MTCTANLFACLIDNLVAGAWSRPACPAATRGEKPPQGRYQDSSVAGLLGRESARVAAARRVLTGFKATGPQSLIGEGVDTDVRAQLTEFIVANYLFGDAAGTPLDDDPLIEVGIVDSTGVLELIQFLETNFGIEVTEAETIPENLGTISNLAAFVTRKQPVRKPVTGSEVAV